MDFLLLSDNPRSCRFINHLRVNPYESLSWSGKTPDYYLLTLQGKWSAVMGR